MKFGKLDARILGAILALAFILLIIMSVVLKQGADWWSAWGQWVGGIGSIGAAAVAVWIAVEGWRRSDRESKEKEERELALKVALWVEQVPNFPGRTDPMPKPEFVLKYVNGGGMPIYQAEATVTFPHGPAPYIDAQLMLRPTTTPENFARDPRTFNEILLAALFKERDLLRAQLTRDGLDDMPAGITPILLDERYVDAAMLMLINAASITFTFTDANRVRWVREPDGRLHHETTSNDGDFLPSLN